MTFLNSIKDQSKKHEFPFDHWEYNNALSGEAIVEIIKADIPDVSKHNLNYDGTRAIDGGAAEFRKGIATGGEEKLMSGLIFVNNANESEDLGTDFYNEKLEKVKTVPYKNNYGYMFTSGPNTWHGMEKKTIVKERRCIQVNYVTFETDWKVNS